METLLQLKNIETYYDLIYALRGVSLTINQGEITTILGSNGAGKSTVLKTILGLIEDQPDKGTIEFNNQRINGRETEDIVELGISYVPEGREIFSELTVKENLMAGAFLVKNKKKVKKNLARVFAYFPVLEERQNQWGGTLSGGQQQMLAIGRALMNNPQLLILDEPSLGLSPILVKEIFQIIKTINQEGVAILLVEQNARIALEIADYGFIMENGRFVLKGKPDFLRSNEDVREFYLGVQSEESIKGYQRWKRKKSWR